MGHLPVRRWLPRVPLGMPYARTGQARSGEGDLFDVGLGIGCNSA